MKDGKGSLKSPSHQYQNGEFPVNASKDKKAKHIIPPKEFKQRDSTLIQLFEEQETVKSVYVCFIAFFIIFVLTCTLKEYIYKNRLPGAFSVIHNSFGKLNWVLLIWIGNNLTTFSIFYCFILWGKIRQKVVSKKIVDNICILLLTGYYILSFSIISFIVSSVNLPYASALIVTMESVRFLMKIHSFVRENVPKILLLESKREKINMPTFWEFSYFLYAPTIIYRDDYPRSKKLSGSFIFWRLLEVFALIIFLAYWFEYIATPFFNDTCKTKVTLIDVVITIIEFSLPSIVILWSTFFIILHSIQNAIGEALGFGDRLFYKDWWTCTDLQTFYRKWNLIVGDWLYTYLHKDIHEIILRENKNLSKFVTILISALVHEWIMTLSTGHFIPVMSTIMLLSSGAMLFSFNKQSIASLLFSVVSTILSISCMVTLYYLEYFARMNLPGKQTYSSVYWTENCLKY